MHRTLERCTTTEIKRHNVKSDKSLDTEYTIDTLVGEKHIIMSLCNKFIKQSSYHSLKSAV